MADIKTNLRELSVAIGISYTHYSKNFSEVLSSSPSEFYNIVGQVVSNDISNAKNILTINNFSDEYLSIIENGLKLGKKIVDLNLVSNFKNITWVGGDTQKNNPIDILVDSIGFSLKEESYILENMGLYKFLNLLTNSKFKRGLHVFKEFSPKEYEAWFAYSWNKLLNIPNKKWILDNEGRYTSKIVIDDKKVKFFIDDEKLSELPNKPITLDEFKRLTKSKSREKVFSKWINNSLSNDPGYLKAKSVCSTTAGKNMCKFINDKLNPINLARLLQIYDSEYYYAKSTNSELSIFHVPSINDFEKEIKIDDISFSVPTSQLNVRTTITNKSSKESLIFRNECRFSHGQLNGTPEAKMYYERGNDLSIIYNQIYSTNKKSG